MENHIASGHEAPPHRRRFTRVQVAVIARKVAAGDLQAQDMSPAKDVAGGPKIEIELVNLAWI